MAYFENALYYMRNGKQMHYKGETYAFAIVDGNWKFVKIVPGDDVTIIDPIPLEFLLTEDWF